MPRPISLPSPWRELAEAVGGVGELAQRLGVNRTTLARWASGDFAPGIVMQEHVRSLARRRGLPEPTFASGPDQE